MQSEEEKQGNKIKKENAKLRNYALFDKLIENSMIIVDLKIVTTRKKLSGPV